jgi:hypothetical protein
MKKSLVGVCGCALLALFFAVDVRAQSAPAAASGASADKGRHHDERTVAHGGALSPALVGSWKAQPEKTALATEFDVSVWGPGASAVRDVSLTIAKSGEATLTVTRKVVDSRDRVKAASTSIEVADLVVQGPQETTGPRIEHAVKVARAERRFPDDPKDVWTIDGLRVRLVSFADDASTVEVRFDTPEGRGSFWQVLTKASGRRP